MPGTSLTLAVLLVHAVLSALALSAFSAEVFEYPKLLVLRAAMLALALCAVWGLVRSRGIGRRAPRRPGVWRDPLLWCAAAFVASGVLSGLHGVSPRRSLLGAEARFQGVATWAGYAALFVAARHVAAERAPNAVALLWASAAASAGVAAYGILQLLGLDPVAWRSVHVFRDQLRPGSTLGNPTFAGAYLAMTGPVVFLLARRAWRRGRPGASSVLCLTGLGSGVVLAATLSRGAWLALAAAVAAALWLLYRSGERRARRALLAACAAAALAAGVLATTPLARRVAAHGLERVAVLAHPSREPRAEVWRAGLAAFRERPWLGAGPDTFQLVYPRHQTGASWPRDPDAAPEHAHNGILELAAGQGALGLAILALAAGCFVRTARRAYARSASADERAVVTAALAALVAWAVSVQFLFTILASGALAAVCAGIVAGRAASAPAAGERALSARAQALWIGVAGLGGSALFLTSALATTPSSPGPWLAAAALGAAVAAVAWALWRVEDPVDTREAGAPEASRPPFRSALGLAFVAGALASIAAAQVFERLVLEPFRADALLRRGRALLAAERPDDAILYLSEVSRRSPRRELAWLELGVAHHRAAFVPGAARDAALSHLEAARRAHERARALEPADSLPHANRARALADLSRLDPAAASYEDAAAGFAQALALAPRHPRILEDAAKAALLAHRNDEAEALAQRALESYPRHAGAWSLLAGAAMARGDLRAAEERLRSALRSDWRGDRAAQAAAWWNLSSVLARAGRAEEARAAADEARAAHPDGDPALGDSR